MSRTTRVSRLEALAAQKLAQPTDWESYGDLGILTRHCIEGFLNREDPLDAHGHQLMLIGGFALRSMTGNVVASQADDVYQLMAGPRDRAYGWTEQKHPDALALFDMLRSRGFIEMA